MGVQHGDLNMWEMWDTGMVPRAGVVRVSTDPTRKPPAALST